MAAKLSHLVAALCFPQAKRGVVSCRSQVAAVRRKNAPEDTVCMPLEAAYLGAARQIPQIENGAAARYGMGTVWGKVNAGDDIVMGKSLQLGARLCIPEARRAVEAAAENRAAIGRECVSPQRAGVAGILAHTFSGLHLPQAQGAVAAGGHKELTVRRKCSKNDRIGMAQILLPRKAAPERVQ